MGRSGVGGGDQKSAKMRVCTNSESTTRAGQRPDPIAFSRKEFPSITCSHTLASGLMQSKAKQNGGPKDPRPAIRPKVSLTTVRVLVMPVHQAEMLRL